MKLFKSLLVAPAALGLMSPLVAGASEVNLNDISNYSDVDSIEFANSFNKVDSNENQLLAGGEGLVDSSTSFDGSFSDTTTLDGKAIFTMGALNYDDSTSTDSEAVQAYYSYTMNLNTSFTGDDNLYVRIKTGNSKDWTVSKTYGGYLSSSKGNDDALKVDKIWYEFPVGERNTVWIGPKIENYYMHGTTPSIYKPVTKQFTLGGNGNAYGASTDTGAGWAYKADNGFAISTNIGTKSNTSCYSTTGTEPCGADKTKAHVNSGILSDESKTSWATQVGYTQPNYSASAIINVKTNGWSDSYYKAGDINGDADSKDAYTTVGLRGWWRPDNTGTATPSVSVGYDSTEYDASSGQEHADAWFVGLNWQDIFTADDRIGAAFGQPTTNENSSVDPFAYEIYYSFKPNDSVTVTPTIFGGSDRNGTTAGDVTGAVIETTFKF